jgi:hypothetical protein
VSGDPPEVKAAQDKLDEAMRELVRVCAEHGVPLIGDGAMIVGYAAVVEGMKYDEDGHTMTSLGHVYDGGEMRLPTAIGLLSLGLDALRGLGSFDD